MANITVNGSNLNPDTTMIKVAHDVNGNVVYPITREEAVILRDGTLLSDKLDSMYTIGEIVDLVDDQFEKMDAQSAELGELIEHVSELTEDTLVYDDDMIITVDTGIDALDYSSLIHNVNDTVQEINEMAVCHMDDELMSVPVITLMSQVNELKVKLNELTSRVNKVVAIVEQLDAHETNSISFVDDELNSETVLIPELSEEIEKMNNIVLSYAERIGRLESTNEYSITYEDNMIVDSTIKPGEMDLLAIMNTLGDRSQLPEDTDVITLLLQLKAQIEQNNQ